jgi:hypothetical protein
MYKHLKGRLTFRLTLCFSRYNAKQILQLTLIVFPIIKYFKATQIYTKIIFLLFLNNDIL